MQYLTPENISQFLENLVRHLENQGDENWGAQVLQVKKHWDELNATKEATIRYATRISEANNEFLEAVQK